MQEMHRDGPPNTVLGIDWSQFDKRLLHQLIRIIHRMWRSYFDFSRYESTSKWQQTSDHTQRITRLWDWMCHAITDTPTLLPNGQLWKWNWNGFGSGYQQTQLMDSFANAVMIYTCLLALGVKVDKPGFWARFQGDDSIIKFMERMHFLYGNDFLDMLAAAAHYYFNAKLNVKKSEIQNKVSGMTVLSYGNRLGLAFRTDEDLLRHLYFPERPQDLGRLAASTLGLAQASLGASPKFLELSRLIWEKLVIRKGIAPKWNALKWMIRVGVYENIDALKSAKIPEDYELLADAFSPKNRTESEKQRQWPTDRSKEFYFIDQL